MSEEIKTEEEVVSTEAVAEVIDPVTALTDDLQRLQAEFANYRKRIERDRALAGEVAISSVLFEFLAILDDLDRAAASYTHIRTHETKVNLVCPRLPKKKKCRQIQKPNSSIP